MTQTQKSCQVCLEEEFKYKCPQCLLKYCSVKCYKCHKETCLSNEVKPSNSTLAASIDIQKDEAGDINNIRGIEESEDRVPIELLQKLGESEEIKAMLSNHHLHGIMDNIYNSNNAADVIAKAMQEPIFTEFADGCLKIVQQKDNT